MVSAAFALGGKRRAFTVSANYAVGLPNGAALFDVHGTAWRATGGNQISVNGVTDTSTSGVIKIVYVGVQLWQIAPSGWYFKTFPSDAWTFNSPGLYSASGTIVNLGDTTGLVDPRNFVWTLSAAGVIAVDGVVDAVTHDVTQIEYFNNQIWQNTIFGWYFKTLPTDGWTQASGAPGTGGTGTRQTILGAQLGNPDNGVDQGLTDNFNSFKNAMGEAPTMWTTYAIDTVSSGDTYWANMKNIAGGSAGGIHNLNGIPGAQFSIPMVGISMGHDQGSVDGDFTDIQSGKRDADFTGVWNAYVQSGFNYLIIRPGWEMNGTWEPWSRGYNGWDDNFYAAWRATFQHIIQNARNYAAAHAGVTIESCWNPGYMYNSTGGYGDYVKLYPGDAWVDHIGIDTYGAYSDGGGAPSSGPLFDSSTVPSAGTTFFSLKDAIAMAIAHGKPLCFPEIGGSPGDTTFPNNVKTVMTANPTCKVSFMALWNKTDGNGPDSYWSVNAASATAWNAMFDAIRATNGPW